MERMSLPLVAAVAACALISAAPTVCADDPPSVVGTWTAEDAEAKATVVLAADGTFTRTITTAEGTQTDKGTYRVVGNVMIVEPAGEDPLAVKFELLTPDKLKLVIPEEGPITMDRATGSGPVRPVGPLDPKDVVLLPIQIGAWYGYIDQRGTVRVQPQFEEAWPFCDGRARVKANGKFGFLDESGKRIVEAKYTDACDFGDGLAPVKAGEKWDHIDRDGKVAFKAQFDLAFGFSEGLGRVTADGKSCFIDRTGKVVFETEVKYVYEFHEGLAHFETDERTEGFIDRTGKVVIEAKYNQAYDFSEGLAAVQEASGGPYGFIDKTGKAAIERKYETASPFSEGLAAVRIDGKYGFIDRTGKLVIPATFEGAWGFRHGLAPVPVGGLYGAIDKTGKVVISPRFEELGEFGAGGVARVLLYGLQGYCDRTGKLVYDPVAPVRSWADLDRAGTRGYGSQYNPIKVASSKDAEDLLTRVRDMKRRPVKVERVGGIIAGGGTSFDWYRTTDQDGVRRDVVFDSRDSTVDSTKARSPVGLFFERAAP